MKKPINISAEPDESGSSGMVLLNVLTLMLIACFVVGSLLGYSTQSIYLTRKSLDTQRAFVAAEAGVDYGVMRMRDILQQYALSATIGKDTLEYLFDQIPLPVSPDERYVYTSPDGEPAFKFKIVDDTPIDVAEIEEGASAGLDGILQRFSVICGARNPETGGGAVVEQELQAVSTCVVRYGVFYEDDLEAHPGVEMSFDGRVHSNGDIYAGGSLAFKDRITSVGGFKQWRKNTMSRNGNGQDIKIKNLDTGKSLAASDYDASTKKYYYLESEYMDGQSVWEDWMTRSTLRWGGALKTGIHGVSKLSPPIDTGDTPHDIIERPLEESDEHYSAVTEEQKFVNKAALYIHVNSDGTIVLKDRNGEQIPTEEVGAPAELAVKTVTADGEVMYMKNTDVNSKNPRTGEYVFATDEEGKSKEGIYQSDNTFYDWRERKTMAPVDIYLDKLIEKFAVGTIYSESKDSEQDGIVYITRDPPLEIDMVVKETNTVSYVYTNAVGNVINSSSNVITSTKKKMPYDSSVNETCVRLRNGSKLLEDDTLGISFVSDLPVYVEGSFNTKGTQSGSTTDEEKTKTAALVAADAVTLLSSNWQDDYSRVDVDNNQKRADNGWNGKRAAVDCAFNGVVMTGNTTTTLDSKTEDHYNGGLENVFRFVENWNGKTYRFAGSIICMWTSETATGPWRPTGKTSSKKQYTNVYNAPKRFWGYDARIYRTKTPPGIPRFFTVEETHWKRVDWAYMNENYK